MKNSWGATIRWMGHWPCWTGSKNSILDLRTFIFNTSFFLFVNKQTNQQCVSCWGLLELVRIIVTSVQTWGMWWVQLKLQGARWAECKGSLKVNLCFNGDRLILPNCIVHVCLFTHHGHRVLVASAVITGEKNVPLHLFCMCPYKYIFSIFDYDWCCSLHMQTEYKELLSGCGCEQFTCTCLTSHWLHSKWWLMWAKGPPGKACIFMWVCVSVRHLRLSRLSWSN